jgi:hypothetical protein
MMKWMILTLLLQILGPAYADDDDWWFPKDITYGICSNDQSQRPAAFIEANVTSFETGELCCEKW